MDQKPPAIARPRVEALDALRALAALAIMLFHYEAMSRSLSIDEPVEILRFRYAMLGVELFFVISGYVIMMTMERSSSAAAFLHGRTARIYPAYWLSVIFVTAILVWNHQFVWWVSAVNLTMLQQFVHVRGLISPYWTLAYELWFYVLMAIVLRCGLQSHIVPLAAIWLVCAFVIRSLGFQAYGIVGILTMLPFGNFFIAGMMIFRLREGSGGIAAWLLLAGCLAYSGFGRADWSHVSGGIYFGATAAFVAAIFAASKGWLDSIASRLLVRIGASSYSLYLLHVPIALLGVLICQRYGTDNLWGVLAAVPLSFAAAIASRRWIEIPGQIAIKAMGRRSASRERTA